MTVRCRDSDGIVGQDFAVADAQGFDPTLLAERKRDEETELDKLGNCEMAVQFLPKRFVGNARVPDNRAGVGQRYFLALGKFLGILKIEKLIVLVFRQPLPSSLDGALYASILAIDRLGHVDAAHFLEFVIDDAFTEGEIPRLGESSNHVRVVSADCLALGPRRALPARMFEVTVNLGIHHFFRIDVRKMGHDDLLCGEK